MADEAPRRWYHQQGEGAEEELPHASQEQGRAGEGEAVAEGPGTDVAKAQEDNREDGEAPQAPPAVVADPLVYTRVKHCTFGKPYFLLRIQNGLKERPQPLAILRLLVGRRDDRR